MKWKWEVEQFESQLFNRSYFNSFVFYRYEHRFTPVFVYAFRSSWGRTFGAYGINEGYMGLDT